MPTSLQDKFEVLDNSLNGELQERTKEIRTAMLAIVAKKHHFQVGPPGTAKSLLVRRIAARIDGLNYQLDGHEESGYFQWLLTRYSVPEELFGPPDITELRNGRYVRVVDRKLPVARLAFLDEIFKGNSSILNALLTIMNERMFFNDNQDVKVPLCTIFGASNELPEGDELWALWDRLHFRHYVNRLQDTGSFVQMLAQAGGHALDPDPLPLLTWDEITEAQEAAENVVLPGDIYEALKTLRDALNAEGIEPTERRYVDSLSIIRANAFLSGRDTAEIEDLRPLQHVMWADPKDLRNVTKAVLDLADPIDRTATDLIERIEDLEIELNRGVKDADNKKKAAQIAVEVHGKLQKTRTQIKELDERWKESGRKKSDTLMDLDKRFYKIAKLLMEQGFGVQERDIVV